LIVILHQPTLVTGASSPYQGANEVEEFARPGSREVSMSSAKTIADILAFSELVDAGSYISNPFTSQPIYIAACAFLREMAAQANSQPSSGPDPPTTVPLSTSQSQMSHSSTSTNRTTQVKHEKHTLLAAAAKENYQRCYQALQRLETYWAGVKYILTALDSKSVGIWDPEIYTAEEMESARRSSTSPPKSAPTPQNVPPPGSIFAGLDTPAEGQMWTLSGNINSGKALRTLLYKNTAEQQDAQKMSPPIAPAQMALRSQQGQLLNSSSHLILSQSSQYHSHGETSQQPLAQQRRSNSYPQFSPTQQYPQTQQLQQPQLPFAFQDFQPADAFQNGYTGLMGDMIVESHDVDMDPFDHQGLGVGLGMGVPWLEYIPEQNPGGEDCGR
jgi:hypothetical protein